MEYETTPIKVQANQQMFVRATVTVGPQQIQDANPGDWIVQWSDGRLEVFSSNEFQRKFRRPQVQVVSGPMTPRNGLPVA